MTSADIRAYLASEFGVDTSAVTDDTPLFSSGLVDSFSLVGIMSFLEEKAKFQIDPADVNLDNFDTIGRILAYVVRAKG
jgi:acyl carrier protein